MKQRNEVRNGYKKIIATLRAHPLRFLLLAALLPLATFDSRPYTLQTTPPEAKSPEIIVEGHDFAFQTDNSGEAGFVKITPENHGSAAFYPIPSFAHGEQAHHDLGLIRLLRVTEAVTDLGSGLTWPQLAGILGLMAVGTAVVSRNRQKSTKAMEDVS